MKLVSINQSKRIESHANYLLLIHSSSESDLIVHIWKPIGVSIWHVSTWKAFFKSSWVRTSLGLSIANNSPSLSTAIRSQYLAAKFKSWITVIIEIFCSWLIFLRRFKNWSWYRRSKKVVGSSSNCSHSFGSKLKWLC